jgi:DNA polymerase III subunit delta'
MSMTPTGRPEGESGARSAKDISMSRSEPSPFPWQAAAAARLAASVARWPHAQLITGPAGIGKAVLAHWMARTLLCESPATGNAPCGTCASCRYAAAGQHPDLRVIEPIDPADEEAKPAEWISVERIRALTRWSELSSHRGGAKVAVIVPAERMNAAAANALLKTLEEPPAGTYFLLVSHQPGRLPPTITSRCRRVVAPRPTEAEGLAWLAQQGLADAGRLLAQANFAPLAAMALADPEYQAERASWLAALASPKTLSPTALGSRIDAGPRETRRDRLGAVVDWLIAWCGDLARVRAGGAPVQNVDCQTQLTALAGAVAALPLFRYHRSLLRQRALLAHPLQPRLVAEALLIDYRDLFG